MELKPDVIVMDLSMPVLGGAEATKLIVERDPRARVLALSAHSDVAGARAALSNGAAGYMLKRSAFDEVARAIRAVAAGETYLDPILGPTSSATRRVAAGSAKLELGRR